MEELLTRGHKIRVYVGVDPSSPEIHLGHAVVLWKLREFQDLGHEVVLLIGDFTAQIGDPTGKSKERVPLSHEQVLQNAKTYREQASKIIQFSGDNPAHIRFNSEWLDKLSLKELIRLASNFTVQQMIERDMFQKRIADNQPIGLHEFLYPLLVGYDCIELDVDVEIGGNDQLFNIKSGRILMEKVKTKKKVVLVCDLLTGSDGRKMSKSFGNAIPVTASPEDMFGQLMAVHDSLIEEYAILCTDMIHVELQEIKKRLTNKENPRDVKLDVAQKIVERYSSPEKAQYARDEWIKSKGLLVGRRQVVHYGSKNEPLVLLVARMADISKSEARRLIQQKAVKMNGHIKDNPEELVVVTRSTELRIGKQHSITLEPS